MSGDPSLPKASDFAPGTVFVIKESDVPLVQVANGDWFNWYGGAARQYDPRSLQADNNQDCSFEQWLAVVEASMKGK